MKKNSNYYLTTEQIYDRISMTTKRKGVLNMKVLVLSNNNFEVKEINNKLEDLQKIVGGYIEIPFLSEVFYENGIDMIINEEGKFIEECKPEIAVVRKDTNEVLDVVHGNCIFASHDDEGETIGLSEEQLAVVMKELKMDVLLSYRGGKQMTVRALFI